MSGKFIVAYSSFYIKLENVATIFYQFQNNIRYNLCIKFSLRRLVHKRLNLNFQVNLLLNETSMGNRIIDIYIYGYKKNTSILILKVRKRDTLRSIRVCR